MDEKLQQLFIGFCKINQYEINPKQVEIINLLESFVFSKKNLFNFFKKDRKLCFYLHGGVGVGKTMLLNFLYSKIEIKKVRMHFNEFMINFHNHRHKEEDDNSITNYVKILKKNYELIYLDEFQVTNIVDAMILGKLFEVIFRENIIVIVSSNTRIVNLYKEGLQREQFIPFIKLIQKYSLEHELIIDEDYRKIGITKLKRFFFPLNEKTSFKINQLFRELTKTKKKSIKNILIKSREFRIQNFYDGIARFNFEDLCKKNIGGEDYIKIADKCNFVIIENIPNFNNENANEQNRFITLIDIFYEKKIPLLLSSDSMLDELGSSQGLATPFKRTISRIYELTSPDFKII